MDINQIAKDTFAATAAQPLSDEQLERAYKRLDGGKQGYPRLWHLKHLARAVDEVRAIDAAKTAGAFSV